MKNSPNSHAKLFCRARDFDSAIFEVTKGNRLHWHDFYELEMTLSGSAIQTINDHEYPMFRGEAHIIRPTDTHMLTTRDDKKVRFCLVQFKKEYLSEDMFRRIEETKGDLVIYLDGESCDAIEHICNAMNRLWNTKDKTVKEIKIKLLASILELFFRFEKSTPVLPDTDSAKTIQKVISYIHASYTAPITAESVAKHFNFNVAYFRRYFKKALSASPKDYINALRLEHASRLLSTTDAKIIDICMNCGYTSMTSFLRDFKGKYNMSPHEFRSKHLK